MKCDVLFFAAHPDDAEISAGGTIARLTAEGKKVAIVDLTAGELGTRGNEIIRATESVAASKILGVAARTNLRMPDGFFEDSVTNRMKIIQTIRTFRPEIIICNSVTDRHSDHGRAARMVEESAFLSGLVKIESADENGTPQLAHRPMLILHYIQDYYIEPDIILDITPYFETKIKAIEAYSSQVFTPQSENSTEPSTPISTPEFMQLIHGRAVQYGRYIGVKYAEGFTSSRPLGVKSLNDLM
jgi:bacillithiol biosynthesis deacetylase BshB1